jgi:hypothetical protein
MANIQKELQIKQPEFLRQLASSVVAKKAKRFKITMAASMGV